MKTLVSLLFVIIASSALAQEKVVRLRCGDLEDIKTGSKVLIDAQFGLYGKTEDNGSKINWSLEVMTPNTDPDYHSMYKSEYIRFIPDSSNRFTIEKFTIGKGTGKATFKDWKALDMADSFEPR